MSSEKKEYHTDLGKGDIGRYVILTGDPGRVPLIAEYLDDAVKIGQNREFVTYMGFYKGERLAVMSTGIGCPSAAIAMEESIRIGADTFFHIGTAGSLQAHVSIGDLVISTAAVRDEGTTNQYLPSNFPAVADHAITAALKRAAEELGARHHLGITHTKDAFFTEGFVTLPDKEANDHHWQVLQHANVISTSMESSVMFILGTIRKVRIGEVMAIVGLTHAHDPTGAEAIVKNAGIKNAIAVTLKAFSHMIETDRSNN